MIPMIKVVLFDGDGVTIIAKEQFSAGLARSYSVDIAELEKADKIV